MRRLNPNFVLGSLSLAILAAASGQLGHHSFARAQSIGNGSTSLLIEYVEFNLAERSRPSDGRGRGGGSRSGNCTLQETATPLTALVPVQTRMSQVSDEPYQSVLSLTTTAETVLWFYVPYTLGGDLTFDFVVQDADDNTLFQSEVTPTIAGPGVLSVPLVGPEPLAEGDRWHWYLVAQCANEDNVYVEGWVERMSPSADLQAQLADATPREQAALYAQNGFWQDALTIVGDRYDEAPQDLQAQADWASLLRAIAPEDLEPELVEAEQATLSTAEILDCCVSP